MIKFKESNAYKEFQEGNIQFKKDIKALYRSLSKVDIVTIVIISYFTIRCLVAQPWGG